MSEQRRYRGDPRHLKLGGDFYDVVSPAEFPERILRYRNDRWAERVGLETLDDASWLKHFAEFSPLPDNLPQPLALRYHGHQFRNYNPDLGDGRGFLYAQLRDSLDDRLLDLGTKGSGVTPWSRAGDGRLTLKGGVREVLATAMLEALGVYTSKTFSLIETGEQLVRGDEPSPTRSSVMVRLSHSHIRFGSFQRQATLGETANVQKLLEYSVEQYFPDLDPTDVAGFLRHVVELSADLAASWTVAGFVHGVLNTDNMNITGESFDYGPYRFLPTLDPQFTAAYFDQSGLYAFGRQPDTVAWNLSRLAETLLEIEDRGRLLNALEPFDVRFSRDLCRRTLLRLGLRARPETAGSMAEEDLEFSNAVYAFLHESQVGFDQFFFDWYGGMLSEDRARRSPEADKYEAPSFSPIRKALEQYDVGSGVTIDASYFAGNRPCGLLIDEIEALWDKITDEDDWSAFEAKLVSIEQMRQALLAGERRFLSPLLAAHG